MNIGLDVGYSAVKAVSGKRRVTFPSVVGTPDRARFSLNSAGVNDIVLAEPANVLIGSGAIIQSRYSTRREDRRWTDSSEWHHLMLAAFTELTAATSVDLCIVTGLPVAYYADKNRLRDRLLGEHRVQREGRRAQLLTVSECRIIPQPFGALLARALDNRGRIADKELATGSVGVIDLGGKTTNLLSVKGLTEIGRETASINVGIWDAVRAIREYLSDHYPDLELRDHEVMDALRQRRAKYYGEPLDLSDVIQDVLAAMAEQVISEATQIWHGAAALNVILVTGGGALLLALAIKAHFRHAHVVDDPIFANALGFWRFSQRLAT